MWSWRCSSEISYRTVAFAEGAQEQTSAKKASSDKDRSAERDLRDLDCRYCSRNSFAEGNGTGAQAIEKLDAEAAETAVGHHHYQVARFRVRGEIFGDFVGGCECFRRSPAAFAAFPRFHQARGARYRRATAGGQPGRWRPRLRRQESPLARPEKLCGAWCSSAARKRPRVCAPASACARLPESGESPWDDARNPRRRARH